MFGSQGFRAKEAAANYKRRIRKLQTDEVRAARFANLHGNAEAAPADEPEAVEPAAAPEAEVTVETQPEQIDAPAPETPADEAGENADEAGDEDAADAEGEDAGDEDAGEGDAEAAPAEGDAAPKKKAGKAKKKAAK